MFKKIAIKIIAKIYHYAIACDRRMYRMYITDKHVFSNMGEAVRKPIRIVNS